MLQSVGPAYKPAPRRSQNPPEMPRPPSHEPPSLTREARNTRASNPGYEAPLPEGTAVLHLPAVRSSAWRSVEDGPQAGCR